MKMNGWEGYYLRSDLMTNQELQPTDNILDVIRNKLTDCSKNNIIFYCNSCGNGYSIPLRCDLILCEQCGERRFTKLREKYLPIIRQQKRLFMLTLTWLKGSENKSTILLRHRQARRLIKKYFDGGIYTFEGLAQHIHAIVSGSFVLESKLKKTWNKITKDSKLVFIKRTDLKGLNYVLKYICKPPTYQVNEYVKYYKFWFHNRRVSTVGIFYNYHQVKIKIELLCPRCNDYLIFWCVSTANYEYPLCNKVF